MKQELTQARLKELLHYDPQTGVFTWRASMPPRGRPGDTAGAPDYLNRQIISINQSKYLAHRLAWLYTYGVWPKQVIDHVNGDPSNNSLKNLRDCSRADNQQNRSVVGRGKSKLVGAGWDKRCGRWVASIMKDYKSYFLGYFDTPEEAHQAYLKAKAQLHTFQPVPRELCTTM